MFQQSFWGIIKSAPLLNFIFQQSLGFQGLGCRVDLVDDDDVDDIVTFNAQVAKLCVAR